MEIEEVSNSDMKEVEVTSLDPKDMRNLTKSRYAFDWKKPYKESLVFVLRIKGAQDILGAMAIVKFPSELRYEVKLLATSRENVGKNKIYEGDSWLSVVLCLQGMHQRIWLPRVCISDPEN